MDGATLSRLGQLKVHTLLVRENAADLSKAMEIAEALVRHQLLLEPHDEPDSGPSQYVAAVNAWVDAVLTTRDGVRTPPADVLL